MTSKLFRVTMQGAMFSVLSSTLAQGIKVWQQQNLSVIDPISLFSFMLIAVITTPPNFLYQHFLEENFPTKTRAVEVQKDDNGKPVTRLANEERLSIPNTIAKFFLEQSIGAAVNTVLFIFLIGTLKGKSMPQVAVDVQHDFWPMITAGWKVWPMVTLLNLVVVPFDYRMIVGNTVGVLFGVYVTLKNL